MSLRGPTNKFFYDREHDLFLYYLILEALIYDDKKDNFVYDSRGNIRLKGGWGLIASKMTAAFGRKFKPAWLSQRYDTFRRNEKYFDSLFEEMFSFRGKFECVRSVMEA